MTAQFHDLFRHHGKEFSVVSAGELFTPASFGMFPIPDSTACWRGNLALYTILDAHLVLDTLYVNLRELQGPLINGATPNPPTDRYGMFNNTYGNLNLPIPYTGSILSEQHVRHGQELVVVPDAAALRHDFRRVSVRVVVDGRVIALLVGLVQCGLRPARRVHARSSRVDDVARVLTVCS